MSDPAWRERSMSTPAACCSLVRRRPISVRRLLLLACALAATTGCLPEARQAAALPETISRRRALEDREAAEEERRRRAEEREQAARRSRATRVLRQALGAADRGDCASASSLFQSLAQIDRQFSDGLPRDRRYDWCVRPAAGRARDATLRARVAAAAGDCPEVVRVGQNVHADDPTYFAAYFFDHERVVDCWTSPLTLPTAPADATTLQFARQARSAAMHGDCSGAEVILGQVSRRDSTYAAALRDSRALLSCRRIPSERLPDPPDRLVAPDFGVSDAVSLSPGHGTRVRSPLEELAARDQPPTLRAVDREISPPPHGWCVISRSTCRVVLAGELGLRLRPLEGDAGDLGSLIVEVGALVRAPGRHSFGGTFVKVLDDGFWRGGLKLRYRYWLRYFLAVDVGAGFLGNEGPREGGLDPGAGVLGHLGLDLGAALGLAADVDYRDNGAGSELKAFLGIRIGAPSLLAGAVVGSVLASPLKYLPSSVGASR